MTERSIIVIGAGMAGLSAGCYGQMNGYRTQIFEMHSLPGGLCTSWTRKDYTFDGCIHWLVGSSPGTSFHRIWRELGAVQGRPMVNHEEFWRFEGADGKLFVVYTNIDRLEQHMKELAPGDATVIEQFCDAARLLTRSDMPVGKPRELLGPLDTLRMIPRMLPLMGAMRKWSSISLQDFASRLQDPFLREALIHLFPLPDFPMWACLATIAWLHNRSAGYPVGGSLEFARAIERRYLGLGGEIRYGSRVEKILVENHRAVGVRLDDGTEHRADIVISAADGRSTLFDMLDGKYLTDEVRGYYDRLPIFRPLIQISLGVARDLSAEPHSFSFSLDVPMNIGGELQHRMTMNHYCFDPTLAPAGKSVVVVIFDADYDYWRRLAANREDYEAEKRAIASAVISRLEHRLSGITEQIEVVDVATPLTYERYTGNWRGSMEGWLLTTRTMRMMMGRGMSKTLPGLEGFYMAGQWVEPGGGVPTSALSGRNAIQLICHSDRHPFVAPVPPTGA